MTASLFQPITLDGLTFPNRIAVAPMCQYSADDGSASDWHLYHWMNLAMSGAGMVTVEMTDVERRGRISHGCLGLYSDDNEAAARRTLDAARRVAGPGTKFGMQLAHAGRKASSQSPGRAADRCSPTQDPWQTVSASAIAYDTAGTCRARWRTRRSCSSSSASPKRKAGRTCRLRFHRIARRAWLSDLPVPVAALQPAHRPLGRLAGKPHAPCRSRSPRR